MTRRSTLSNRIAEQIRDAIVNAEFMLGEALSEDRLGAAFGVSRTPIRKALNVLELQGLVSVVPKSGTYVFRPCDEDIVELCEFRATLEIKGVELSSRCARTAVLCQLEEAYVEMEQAVDVGDYRSYGQADTKFHCTFLDNSGNRYLLDAYGACLGRVAALRTHLAGGAEGEPQRSFKEHARIIELFRSGCLDEMQALLIDHIKRTRENYVQALRAGELDKVTSTHILRRKLSVR